MMRVIVLADRSGSELEPLTKDIPVALLPIAAKPLLIHCLEELAIASLTRITLVVSSHSEAVKTVLGSGARWGLNIDYVLSRGEEPAAEILARLQTGEHPTLLLRGDVLRSASLKSVVARLREGKPEAGELTFQSRRAHVTWYPDVPPSALLDAVTWPPLPRNGHFNTIDDADGQLRTLDTLADYHRANIDAAAGKIPGLLIPGRAVALGLTVGRQSRISPRTLRQGAALVGSNCRIDSHAVFQGDVVISDNVLVDREAEIQNSVVLPNTYVGQLVHIQNAIVKGSDLIRVDTGAHLRVADSFLIADLGVNGTSEYFTRPLNRLAGFVLLLLSLPLWPLAFMAASVRDPRQAVTRRILRGNRIRLNEFGIRERSPFSAWEFNCKGPILRYLPRLWAVAHGDLKLIGTLPISEQEAAERVDDWQRAADRAPSGLIGPSQLLLPEDSTEEDIILSDALYARQRSIGRDLSLLGLGVRQLFRLDNWRGSRTANRLESKS
jgi:NDP-sugar pyrophosphorylase family protein